MEDQATDNSFNKELEKDLYAIDTAKVFMNELALAKYPDYNGWKKCPSEEGHKLENLILDLIVKNLEPAVDYSLGMREYLIEKFNKFNKVHFGQEPFHFDFFVTGYIEPRSDQNRNLFFGGTNYYYFYNCDQHLIITKKKVGDEDFELLFAFALRQCDLMKVDQFLDYHLQENFSGEVKIFCKYVKQILRKFSQLLFTGNLNDSINDWIKEKEKSIDENETLTQKNERIKTNLSVDQIAYLFKALMENHLIKDDNKSAIVRVACGSFYSKVKGDLKFETFKPRFDSPKDETLKFWKMQFEKLVSVTEKQLKKNLK